MCVFNVNEDVYLRVFVIERGRKVRHGVKRGVVPNFGTIVYVRIRPRAREGLLGLPSQVEGHTV